jgi:acyl-homoserine lactone acylase PvdQ
VHRQAALAVALLAALVLVLAPGEAATPKRDYAAAAWSILPPGQNGSTAFNRNTRDQAALYDGLTPLAGRVTDADIARYFKPAPLGLGRDRARTREQPRGGVTVVRDSFGVAHVTGKTAVDVAFGAGWVTAADRGIVLQLLRGPARLAALDVPGVDPFALALSGRSFVPSREAEAYVSNQLDALRSLGPRGTQLLAVIRAYAAGINAWYRLEGAPVARFTPNDVVALTALFATRFGSHGGQEVRNSMFLDALEASLGADQARRVFADLRSANDPESPFSVKGTFPYNLPSAPAPGSVVVDDGSYTGAPLARSSLASSNALLVGRRRSRTGHPILLAGPQVGYLFPGLLAEMELSGGGFATRGAVFPGVPFVLVGRGPDYAWSATSSQADLVDLFVETLCADDRHYLYRGQCQAMRRVSAGVLTTPGAFDQPVSYYETTHGPVLGYATVGGRRVAISMQRSTRGREILSAPALYDLNTARVTSASQFVQTMNRVEFGFNWFYADDRDIAFFSSGRLPRRGPGLDPALPTAGTGEYDWRGFVPFSGHARAINPSSGVILNWNNRPAVDVGAGDANFAYGSVQRVELLIAEIAKLQRHTYASVASAMNRAGTQDLRAAQVWAPIRAVLRTGPAPTVRAEAAVGLVDTWAAEGGNRLDADLDGRIDAAGAAVLDAAWEGLAEAVLSPVLGPLTSRLAALHARSDDPGPNGSAYLAGWYGYVDKDLRALLGRPVRGGFSRRYCGGGVLEVCREALWRALNDAAARLEASQGADPALWRADATGERIRFLSGLLPDTMRWTNRPTFQQLMSFSGHRPR